VIIVSVRVAVNTGNRTSSIFKEEAYSDIRLFEEDGGEIIVDTAIASYISELESTLFFFGEEQRWALNAFLTLLPTGFVKSLIDRWFVQSSAKYYKKALALFFLEHFPTGGFSDGSVERTIWWVRLARNLNRALGEHVLSNGKIRDSVFSITASHQRGRQINENQSSHS